MEIEVLFDTLKKMAPGLTTEDFTDPDLAKSPRTITKLGVCVDPTAGNIHQAVDKGIEILISYHPWQGEAEKTLLDRGLEIWPLHEAWDHPAEGVIYTFGKEAGLADFYCKGEIVIGRTAVTFREFIEGCQRILGRNIIAYTGSLKEQVQKAAIWAGPGFLPNYKKFWETCLAEECDTILSSEVTLSALRYSQAHQLKLIDLGHSAMAKPGMNNLAKLLRENVALQDCTIDFLDDIYTCNFYTNCSFADQFTEADEIFFEADR
ncbi:MAG: Nif3-like dinuclear metal center hexameric protein [Bacillota bacterium]